MCGKYIDDVKIIGSFSFDSKIFSNYDSHDFSELVKDVVVADDPIPSILYVDEDKSAEKEQENRERIKEINNLSEKLHKLLEEVAFVIGKHIEA